MRRWLSNHSKAVAAGLLALFCALLGVMLLDPDFVPGSALARASYDSYFSLLNLNDLPPTNSPVMLVYLDLESHRNQHQDPTQPWPRELYAQLITRLKSAGARVVVFDVVFDSLGTNTSANTALRDAIASHGRVVLAGELHALSSDSGEGTWGRATRSIPPIDEFRRVAAGWGLGEVATDEDFVVRRYYIPDPDANEPVSNLTLAAAQAFGLDTSRIANERSRVRWLHYYAPPFSLPHRSFSQVLNPGDVSDVEFRDKIVFVGARPIAGLFKERRDEFRSPFHVWGKGDLFMPGVEVHATGMLNLIRNDWLSRPSDRALRWWFMLAGVVLGAGLVWLRPVQAAISAAVVSGMVTTLAAVLFRHSHVWFPWLIVAVVQTSAALGGSVLCSSIEWYRARRRFEAARRVAEARIREQAALIEKAHDAIQVRDLDGRVTYANPSAERLFGWPLSELSNGSAAQLFSDPAAVEALRAALEHGEWNGELRPPARSGKVLTLESRWTLLRDDAGQPNGLLIISSDATEKRQLEAESLRMQRMEAVGALAGGMAHDLNNALAPILMGTQLLRRDAKDDNARRILSLMETSTRRGADMVRQVLLFARGKQGDFERLDAGPLVKEVEKLARDTFPQNISVAAQVAADLWPVRANATQLHQVLLNLCVNARDAMPDGGSLSLAADNVELDAVQAGRIPEARPGRFVVLMVSDTGAGIPPELLPKIFEPFFTTKAEGRGTGLGLSTTARILKAHDGFISVQSQPGEGTTFEVYLPPLASSSAETGDAPSAAPPHGRGQMILVADDDEAVRELLRRCLDDHGYRVLTASNGAEAVSAFREASAQIALIISDQSMPVMDGPTAVAAIRRSRPDMPALFLSGEGEFVEEHFDPQTRTARLPKPVALEKLLGAVARGLDTM